MPTAVQPAHPFSDDVALAKDDLDPTRRLFFQLSRIATGQSRTVTWPDQDVTITGGGGAPVDFVVVAGSWASLRDAIEGTTGPHATIAVPDGTYLCTDDEASPLVAHAGLRRIIGQSRDGVIIDADNVVGTENNPLIRTFLDLQANPQLRVESITIKNLNLQSVVGIDITAIQGSQGISTQPSEGQVMFNVRCINIAAGTSNRGFAFRRINALDCVCGTDGVVADHCGIGFEQCFGVNGCRTWNSEVTGYQACQALHGSTAQTSNASAGHGFTGSFFATACFVSGYATAFVNCTFLTACKVSYCATTAYKNCRYLTNCEGFMSQIGVAAFEGCDGCDNCFANVANLTAVCFKDCINLGSGNVFGSRGAIKYVNCQFRDVNLETPTLSIDCDGVSKHGSITPGADYHFESGGTDTAFSINIWSKISDVTNAVLFAHGDIDGSGGWVLYYDASDKLTAKFFSAAASTPRIARLDNVARTDDENLWTMITLTKAASNVSTGIKIYVNAVQVDDTADDDGSYGGMFDPVINARIFSDSAAGGRFTTGKFGPIQVFDGKVLSQAEIDDLINKNGPGNADRPMSISRHSAVADVQDAWVSGDGLWPGKDMFSLIPGGNSVVLSAIVRADITGDCP